MGRGLYEGVTISLSCYFMSKWFFIIILAVTDLCSSCNNVPDKSSRFVPPVVKPDTVAVSVPYVDSEYQASVALCKKIAEANDIKVISYSLLSDWGNQVSIECKNWRRPTKDEVAIVIRKLKPTSGQADYESHPDFSCNIVGKIKIDNSIYDYKINAGGYAFIGEARIGSRVYDYKINADDYALGDARICAGTDTSLKKYFLSLEYTEKDW